MLKELDLKEFKSNKTQLFKTEQYSNSTRAAYQNLISYAGVSANKVDKVVNIVLPEIDGIQLGRLSRSNFAKFIAIQLKGMAKY